MLGRNYSARSTLEKMCANSVRLVGNPELTMYFDELRFARQPGHNAVSEPKNDRVYLDPSNLDYFFNPSVKFVTSVTDWLPCCERRGMMIFLPSGEISK